MPFPDLDWSSFDIPDGSAPVQVAYLRIEPDTRALTLLVRFPAGWSRTVDGYYEAAEDAIFLEGTVEIAGETYGPGDHAWFPAGFVRRTMVSPDGGLALARFEGPARWVRSAVSIADEKPVRGRLEKTDAADASPFGPAVRLHRSSWLLDTLEPGTPSPVAAEVFELASRTWAWVPAGTPLPDLRGLCFCRTYE